MFDWLKRLRHKHKWVATHPGIRCEFCDLDLSKSLFPTGPHGMDTQITNYHIEKGLFTHRVRFGIFIVNYMFPKCPGKKEKL